jgi:heme A synthase
VQRWIAAVALLLTVVVTATSAHIRLAQSGVGCEPWPACHARAEGGVADPDRFAVARATHRVSASVVGALVLGLAVFGWSRYTRADRVAMVLALGLVAFLAALGRATPSPAAVVTQANVLGGFALAGALAWLAAARAPAPGPRGVRIAAGAALAAIAVQAVIGALISVRHAVAACPDLGGCAFAFDPALLDPFAATPPMLAEEVASPGRQGLQSLHRAWGLATLCLGAAATAMLYRNGARRAAAVLGALLAAQAALGLAIVLRDAPLAAAVAHNALAALAVATLAFGVRACPPQHTSGSPAWS